MTDKKVFNWINKLNVFTLQFCFCVYLFCAVLGLVVSCHLANENLFPYERIHALLVGPYQSFSFFKIEHKWTLNKDEPKKESRSLKSTWFIPIVCRDIKALRHNTVLCWKLFYMAVLNFFYTALTNNHSAQGSSFPLVVSVFYPIGELTSRIDVRMSDCWTIIRWILF